MSNTNSKPPSFFKYHARKIIDEIDEDLTFYSIALQYANTDRMNGLEEDMYIKALKLGKLLIECIRDTQIL